MVRAHRPHVDRRPSARQTRFTRLCGRSSRDVLENRQAAATEDGRTETRRRRPRPARRLCRAVRGRPPAGKPGAEGDRERLRERFLVGHQTADGRHTEPGFRPDRRLPGKMRDGCEHGGRVQFRQVLRTAVEFSR